MFIELDGALLLYVMLHWLLAVKFSLFFYILLNWLIHKLPPLHFILYENELKIFPTILFRVGYKFTIYNK